MGTPTTRRRWFRNLLLAVPLATVVVVTGFMLLSAHRIRRGENAVAHLRELGANAAESPTVPTWWRTAARFAGVSADAGPFGHMTASVALHGATATPDALRAAAAHPDLDSLSVRNAPLIDDDALAAVRDCTRLETFYLSGARVTDAGLRHLGGLRWLATVVVEDCDATDEGIRFLAGLPSVTRIHCGGPKVTGATVHDLTFTAPDGGAPRPGTTVTVAGRLALRPPPAAGTFVTVTVHLCQEGVEVPGRPLRAVALVTPDAAGAATFSAVASNGGNGEAAPGTNAVYMTVVVPGRPLLYYRLARTAVEVAAATPRTP
jgi:hypothetical protein